MMERLGNSSQSPDVAVPRCETHLAMSILLLYILLGVRLGEEDRE